MNIIHAITGSARRRYDADALDWIERIEDADADYLETPVKMAYDKFIRGVKTDAAVTSLAAHPIKASCMLAGARTLAGCLTPLVGTAPTNNNFVSGDYNRVSGLIGDGTTKYLNSNRNNNADPQNSKHLAFWASTLTSPGDAVIGVDTVAAGGSWIGRNSSAPNTTSAMRINGSTSYSALNAWQNPGLYGASRSDSASVNTFSSAGLLTGASSSSMPTPPSVTPTTAPQEAGKPPK